MILILESLQFMIRFLSLILSAYAIYYAIFVVISLFKRKPEEKFEPKYHFTCLIAARNEELVIGNLVKSLKAQNYPAELIDIIVLPNNCTDNTKQAALDSGAKVMECTVPTKTKGEVLHHIMPKILEREIPNGAICVFDADNLVDANFFTEMNSALCRGASVAQCYRDSKNPYDSAISSCYSIYYWMINRFYSQSHSNIGMSAIINGSGFAINSDYLREKGGWNTVTITEDIEFTAICALDNQKIAWVPNALIYDEQPLTFMQSWKQRKRWTTGLFQGTESYLPTLFRTAVKNKSFLCWDQFIFFFAPVMQVIFFILFFFRLIFDLISVKYLLVTVDQAIMSLVWAMLLSYAVVVVVSFMTVLLEKKWHRGIIKGILTFGLFIFSWMPINVICMIKKQTVWEPIEHVKDISFEEFEEQMSPKE